MKILAFSDLHIEHWGHDPEFDRRIRRAAQQAHVCVLAGDIGTGTQGLEWALDVFPSDKPLLYVAGNHEFYGQHIDVLPSKLKALASMARDSGRLVHFLNNSAVEIYGVQFLGCTLWTDFELFGACGSAAAQEIETLVTDYRRIRILAAGSRLLRTSDTVQLHKQSRAWLQAALEQHYPAEKVVITHHLPSLLSVPARFREHPVTPAFASHLDSLMPHAHAWIHGHTHETNDYELSGCQVVSNPRGYRKRDGGSENRDFRFDAFVEVEAGPWT